MKTAKEVSGKPMKATIIMNNARIQRFANGRFFYFAGFRLF